MSRITEVLKTMDYGVAPEANDEVRAWLGAHEAHGHFIGGHVAGSAGGASFEVFNPATGERLARCAQGTPEDVALAVAAARKALPGWSALPGHARSRYLLAMARTLQKRERFFAVLESMDNGKPIRESRDLDLPLAVRHFYHHAGWADVLDTEFPGQAPVGVCGQIIPWNFPLLMLAWKVAPALAAGNTVVLKPAELTPLSALAFAGLCREIGLPPGVLNIVTGDGSTGAALVSHPDVDKIAFTGSTEVGRAIRRQTAGSGKKLSLELGGKSPFIVFDDADLDSAVEGVVDSIWFNQGQVCCAGSRLLVQASIAEGFHAKLKARARRLRIGSPLDKSTDIGAVIDAGQLARIRSMVADGCREGAVCWQPETALPAQGFYYPPTLLTGVGPGATVAQEEIFGPVLVSMSFRTHEEAIALANNSRYGLSASIWSETLGVALDAAARVRAGVVWINGSNVFDAAAGFGGYGESGFGREGGREGMAEYLQPARAQAAARQGKASRRATGGTARPAPDFSAAPGGLTPGVTQLPLLDRTAKLFIGGRQVRPDGGASFAVSDAKGRLVSQAGLGSRKDIRNAVEAAVKAAGWSGLQAHQRAQVLYYVAENLESRAGEFAARLQRLTGCSAAAADEEVRISLNCLAYYAAQADKFDGRVHATRSRHITLALNEPWGVMGVAGPDSTPLLSMVSLLAPALALGNRVVFLPSQTAPLIATDFYQVLETSDMPPGVVNIVTGERRVLSATLADHDEVRAFWLFAPPDEAAAVEQRAAGNLKVCWCVDEAVANWPEAYRQCGPEFLRRASQVKNIWVPYGA